VLLLKLSHAIYDINGEKAIDNFFDDDSSSNWVILAGDVEDQLAHEWNNDDQWDTITDDIETQKGHFVTRKCENVFGNRLCLCQFKRLVGVNHNCHESASASSLSRRQKNLRSFQNLRVPQSKSVVSPQDISAAKELAQNELDNMLSLMGSHPNFKQLTGGDVQDANDLLREEREIEADISAAKVDIEGDENNLLDEEEVMEEVEQIYEEVEEFEEEIGELEEDLVDENYAGYGDYEEAEMAAEVEEGMEELAEIRGDLEEELAEMEDELEEQLDEMSAEEMDVIGYEGGNAAAMDEEYQQFDEEYDDYDQRDQYDQYEGDAEYDQMDEYEEQYHNEYDAGYAAEVDDEHIAIIDVLDNEIDTQEKLIERQSELIDALKEDNAMKEEIIEELVYDDDYVDEEGGGQYGGGIDEFDEYDQEEEEEIYEEREILKEVLEEDLEEKDYAGYDQYGDEMEDVGAYQYGEAVEEQYEQYDQFDNLGAAQYDDDDAGYEALREYDAEMAQKEEYYDEVLEGEEQGLVDYHSYYDDEGGSDSVDDVFMDALEGDSETLLQKKEANAMIADAFWGLEVYSVAFGVLLCLCIVCACHRCRSKSAAEMENGYSQYNTSATGSGGFKHVFGDVDDERDPEMGRSIRHDSEEEERLYSK